MKSRTSQFTHIEELASLTLQAEKHGLKSLDNQQVLRFGQLYRQSVATLSRFRQRGGSQAEIEELNRLVGRAYQQVYTAPPRRSGVRQFFINEIPQAFRSNIHFFLLAWAVILLAAVVAGFKVNQDPMAADILVGAGWSAAIEDVASRHAEQQDWLPADMRSVAGSFIAVNNIHVVFITFALGVFWGLGTLIVLLRNGAMLGAVTVGVHNAGASLDFWAFVAPHGVPELTAIAMAGAAGLRLGWSLVDPGPWRRGEAFRLAGYDAIRLIMACVVMLIWAAVVEAFISPVILPYSLKFAISAAEAVVLILYFTLAGRSSPANPTFTREDVASLSS